MKLQIHATFLCIHSDEYRKNTNFACEFTNSASKNGWWIQKMWIHVCRLYSHFSNPYVKYAPHSRGENGRGLPRRCRASPRLRFWYNFGSIQDWNTRTQKRPHARVNALLALSEILSCRLPMCFQTVQKYYPPAGDRKGSWVYTICDEVYKTYDIS